MPEPTAMDRLVLGPDAASAAFTEPAPPPDQVAELPPRPQRPPPRRRGPIELATARDLRALPDALRQGSIAAAALNLAREIDTLDMTARDTAGHTRELRMCMTQLADMSPGERKGDSTDMLRERRERRMATAE